MDAITLLKNDHKTVEALFRRFEKAGDQAYAEKRQTVDRIIEELSVHAAVEEQLFYPVTRATVPKSEDIALESLEEHHIVKWVLSELEHLRPEDERFDAKVTVLMENVRHHVEEEEEEYFPMVRDELGRSALADLGDAMATAKKVAPTHPHPRSPDTPPGNVVAGTAAGVADRVGDLVATVLRRKTPKNGANGAPAVRGSAAKVRASGAVTAEAIIDSVKETKRSGKTAGRGATSTAKAAKASAKGTATSARSSAKRAATTAKGAATTTHRTARKATTATKKAAKARSSR